MLLFFLFSNLLVRLRIKRDIIANQEILETVSDSDSDHEFFTECSAYDIGNLNVVPDESEPKITVHCSNIEVEISSAVSEIVVAQIAGGVDEGKLDKVEESNEVSVSSGEPLDNVGQDNAGSDKEDDAISSSVASPQVISSPEVPESVCTMIDVDDYVESMDVIAPPTANKELVEDDVPSALDDVDAESSPSANVGADVVDDSTETSKVVMDVDDITSEPDTLDVNTDVVNVTISEFHTKEDKDDSKVDEVIEDTTNPDNDALLENQLTSEESCESVESDPSCENEIDGNGNLEDVNSLTDEEDEIFDTSDVIEPVIEDVKVAVVSAIPVVAAYALAAAVCVDPIIDAEKAMNLLAAMDSDAEVPDNVRDACVNDAEDGVIVNVENATTLPVAMDSDVDIPTVQDLGLNTEATDAIDAEPKINNTEDGIIEDQVIITSGEDQANNFDSGLADTLEVSTSSYGAAEVIDVEVSGLSEVTTEVTDVEDNCLSEEASEGINNTEAVVRDDKNDVIVNDDIPSADIKGEEFDSGLAETLETSSSLNVVAESTSIVSAEVIVEDVEAIADPFVTPYTDNNEVVDADVNTGVGSPSVYFADGSVEKLVRIISSPSLDVTTDYLNCTAGGRADGAREIPAEPSLLTVRSILKKESPVDSGETSAAEDLSDNSKHSLELDDDKAESSSTSANPLYRPLSVSRLDFHVDSVDIVRGAKLTRDNTSELLDTTPLNVEETLGNDSGIMTSTPRDSNVIRLPPFNPDRSRLKRFLFEKHQEVEQLGISFDSSSDEPLDMLGAYEKYRRAQTQAFVSIMRDNAWIKSTMIGGSRLL